MQNFELFDQGLDRKGTACAKWDFQNDIFGGPPDILPFWVADSDYRTCQAVIDAIKTRADHGAFGYSDADDDYRDAIAGWIERRHSWKIDPQWLFPTEGIVPTLATVIEAITEPGDGVVIQPPVYDPFFEIIEGIGRTIVANDLICDETGYHMDFDDLDKCGAAGAKVMLLCSPHNPVGRLWTTEELTRLAEICARHDMYVLSDEIHWDLILGGREHITMGRIPIGTDRLVVAASCSKTFNIAGLEASSFIVPNQELRERILRYRRSRGLFGPNLLGMTAAKAACTYGDDWVDQQAAFLTRNAQIVRDFLKRHLPRIGLVEPEATYLLWLDARAYGLTSDQLVDLIVAHGASLNNGRHYGENYDGFIRLNIACPLSQLMQGLDRIKRALDSVQP